MDFPIIVLKGEKLQLHSLPTNEAGYQSCKIGYVYMTPFLKSGYFYTINIQ